MTFFPSAKSVVESSDRSACATTEPFVFFNQVMGISIKEIKAFSSSPYTFFEGLRGDAGRQMEWPLKERNVPSKRMCAGLAKGLLLYILG